MSARTLIATALLGLGCAACQTLAPATAPAIPPAPAPVAETAAPPVAATPAAADRPRASCVPRALARAPRYPDSDQALRDAGGAADRYQLMAAGRLLRIRRLAELERIVEACRDRTPP